MQWFDVMKHPMPTDRDVLVTCHQDLNDYCWLGIHHPWDTDFRDIVAWAEMPVLAQYKWGEWQ